MYRIVNVNFDLRHKITNFFWKFELLENIYEFIIELDQGQIWLGEKRIFEAKGEGCRGGFAPLEKNPPLVSFLRT